MKLYKGEIDLQFDEEFHKFTVNGKPVKSVTYFLNVIDKSSALIYWAVNLMKDYLIINLEKLLEDNVGDETLKLIEAASQQHRIKKETAGNIGTEVHRWIEVFIKDTEGVGKHPLPKDPKVYNGVSAFLKWVDEHKVKFISSEKQIYSKKYHYAGIMDAEAKIGGKTCVIDFKTSSGIYPAHRFQAAAYQAAMEEMTGREYTGDKWIIKLGKKDGEFEAHQFGNQKEDFKAFLAAKELTERLDNLKVANNHKK